MKFTEDIILRINHKTLVHFLIRQLREQKRLNIKFLVLRNLNNWTNENKKKDQYTFQCYIHTLADQDKSARKLKRLF